MTMMAEEMVSEFNKHPLEAPIPVHVAACLVEIPPSIQVESQPAMTVMTQEMVSELQKHPLEGKEVVRKANEAVEMATMSTTEDSESEEDELKSQEQVASAEETSVQAKANGFDEVMLKTVSEASKPHLPHKTESWVRFVTCCCGGPAVRALDKMFEQEMVGSAEKTRVQAKANGLDEATLKNIPEASKLYLPHKNVIWMRFVTFCCGAPAVRALDDTFKQGQFSCCCCAEKKKRSICPDNTLAHTITSFCCGGPQKLFAL